MPEGDVVARVARRLTAALADGPLVRAELRWPTLAGANLVGVRSLGSVSYGKHLLTRFDDGRTLHTHLRMDGVWRVTATAGQPRPQARPQARPQTRPQGNGSSLQDPTLRAVLATRKWTCRGYLLGMMDLVRTRDEHLLLAHLGPDLMAPDAEDHLDGAIQAMAAQHGRTIGEVLLDQRIAAGIGTIWMAETLFRHRISPWRPAPAVNGREVLGTASRLMRASAEAVAAPGSTEAVPLAVHGRSRQPCRRCGTPIAVAPVGVAPTERPAFHCPTCQPR